MIGLVSLAFLGAAAASCLISYLNWRALSEQRHLSQAEGYAREDYMALVGVFVGVTTVLGLIWSGISPIWCDVCNTYR